MGYSIFRKQIFTVLFSSFHFTEAFISSDVKITEGKLSRTYGIFFVINQNLKVNFMKKIIQVAVLLSIFLSISATNIFAQRAYFVKNGYTGSNTDTVSTIQKAIEKSVIGLTNIDTIFLMPGTYSSDFVNIYGLTSRKFLITSLFLRDTTKREYLTQTILDGTSQTNNNGIISNSGSGGSYGSWSDSVILSGITIQNFQNVLGYVNGLNYIKFSDCNFSNNGSTNGFINNSNGVIEISHCVFKDNIGNISVSGYGSKNIISRNKFTNQTISGGGGGMMYGGGGIINISGSAKTIIENNLFTLCAGNVGNFTIYINYPSSDSIIIRNNTFFQNEINSIKVDANSNSSPVTIFQNNLFNSNNLNSSTEFTFGSNVKVKWLNNVTYLPLNKYVGFGATDTVGGGINFVLQDLKFVKTFYPGPNSPFIGLGLPNTSPLVDLDGIIRPNPTGSAPEIGCFEIDKSLSVVTLSNLESNGAYVTLNWSANIGPNDKGFAIYRSITSSFSPSNLIGTINSNSVTSYIDSNKSGNVVATDTKYFYSVKKVGSITPVADISEISNILFVTPRSITIEKPTNLIATAAPSKIKLNWAASSTSGTFTYNLYRSVADDDMQLLASGLNTTSYVDATIKRNVNYKYKVKASNSENNTSSFSDSVVVSTNGKNVWYVDAPGGSDAELGSEGLPFKTISYALQNVISGDTILLKKGTYTSTIAYQLDSNIVMMSYFPRNNDSTFLTGTIIDGTGGNSSGLFTGNTSKISLSGLTIQNISGSMYFQSNNNWNSNNLYILNQNIFKNNNNWNTFITANPNSIFRNNTFLNNRASISFQGTTYFEGNTVWANSYSSMGGGLFNLNTSSTGKFFINNNRFIYSQSLFQLNNSNLSDSILFVNNTFIYKNSNNGNMGSSIYSISFNLSSYRSLIRNNIFYPSDNFNFGSSSNGNKPSIKINNNLLNTYVKLNTNISNYTLSDTVGNIYGGDPGFVSALNDDYKLSATSPLIGRGMLNETDGASFARLPKNDILNAERPFPANSNPDLGAYESISALTAPVITAIQGGNQRLNLMWKVNSTNNLDSFYLYKTGPNVDNTLTLSTPYKAIFKDSVTFLDITGITNIDRYYYRLKAKDVNGNLSEASNLMVGRANVEPDVVTNLVSDASPGMIRLEWKHVDSALFTYNIYRGLASNNKTLYAQDITNTFFIDSSIARGTSYYYSVQAVDSIGAASAYSNDVQLSSNGVKWIIDASASATGGIGSINRPFKTISNALRYAIKNDTLLLNSGTYKEQLRFTVKPLVLTSNYNKNSTTAESIIQSTIIDGATLNANTNLLQDSTSSVSGMIKFNGISFNNVKGYIFNNANRYAFQKCNFNNNTGSGVFGGSYISFDSCRFVNNGPLNNNMGNNLAYLTDSISIKNSYITGNFSSNNAIFSISSNSYSPTSTQSIIENNTFIKNGGNTYNSYIIYISSGNIIIRNNIFTNNNCASIRLSPYNNYYNTSTTNSIDIINNTIISNTAEGLKFDGGTGKVNIANNIIQNNSNDISINSYMGMNNTLLATTFTNNIIGTNKGDTVLKSLANIGNLDTASSLNNFSTDFQFIDTAQKNYTPTPFSKALGGAKASFVNFGYDQIGGLRPNPAGTIPDIGAIESVYNINATNLINGEGGDRKIGIQWLPIKSTVLNKYYIYRSTSRIDTLINTLPHDSVSASLNSYLDITNITNLTPLYYRVKAGDNNYNLSAYSNEIMVTPNKPLNPPISLSLLSAPRILKLTWVDSTKKAKSFKVFKGTTRANVSLFVSGITNSYFSDSTAAKGITYFYCVKSVDSVGAVSDSSMFVSGKNSGNIFYVDNSSLTNGIGALDDPRNTIQSAINSTINGDTIIIKPGNYQERLLIDSAITIGSMFLLNNDTTFISRTTINGGTASSTTSPGGSSGMNNPLISSKSYMSYTSGGIVIKGLQFEQFAGSLVSDYSRKITLSNCIIKSINANCNSLINSGQYSLIEKNQFYNNTGQITLNSNSILTQNKFINHSATCNNFINATNGKTKIYNNLFINVQGIDIYLSGSDTNFIVNNTFYKNSNSSYQFIKFESSSKNFIYNNIFNKPSGRDFLFNINSYPMYQNDSSKSIIDLSYNFLDSALSIYTGLTTYNMTKSRKNFSGFSPRFTNVNNNDFSLSKSSPAIGIGIDTTIVPNVDLNGSFRANPVGSKPDLGAIESIVGIASPFISSYKVVDKILNLEWKIFDTVGISSFKIYRSELDSLPTTFLYQTVNENTLNFRDSLQYGKSYNYRIKSIKRDSTTSDFSDPIKVNVYAPPSIVKPLNLSVNVNLSDTLSWQSVGANLRYDFQIGKSELEATNDSSKMTSNKYYTISNLLQNKFYYWRVRVKDDNTTSAWSSFNRFQTRVSAPILSDTNFVNIKNYKLNFKFDSANIKLVKIYKGVDQNNLNLYDSINTTFNYSDTLSYLNSTYFGVSVVNTNNVESAISNIKKITTFTQPSLLSPSDGIGNLSLKPVFNWITDSLSNKRIIQISDDSTFTSFNKGYNIIYSSKENAFNITDSSKLLPNTNYYWRVKAGDKNGFGDWSLISKFQTFVESPLFTSLLPANKIDTLNWRKVANGIIKNYKIYRDTIPQATSLIDSISGESSTYINKTGLSLNVKYYYRIKAVNNNGIESDFSNELSATPFNTLPKTITLTNKTFNNVGEFNFVRSNYSAVGSIDPDGKIADYKWFVNDSLVNATDSILIYYFNQGSNKVKLLITDNDGGKDSSSALVNLSSFVKSFEGGFLGGIAALSPNIIYTADTTYNPINGASISKLDRSGNTVYPLVVSSKIFTTPSVSSDSSVFITSGSSLNGFNKSGAPLWSTIPLGGLSYVTPTIDSLFNRIYVGVSNKNFFAIDYKTGKVVWNLIGDAPVNASAIITGDRKLVFTSQAGTLYGFDIRTNVAQTAAKWSTNFGEVVTKSPAVDANNNLIIGTESGKVLKVKLNDDGTVARTWSVSVNASIQSSPVIDGDGFIYVGNTDGDFYKLNPDNGAVIWKYATGAAIKSTPTISEFGNIYISNTNGVVTALTTGKILKWTYQADGPISANMLYISNMLYIGTERGKFLAIYDNPVTNTVNTGLSMNVDKNRLRTYSYGSLASSSPLNLEEEYGYYYDAFKQGKFDFTVIDNVVAKEPVWGTFQGNYRRTGSKTFECPDVPVVKIPNCIESDEVIKITTANLSNKYWVVNDVVLDKVTDTSLYVKSTDKYKLMAYNNNGCNVYSSDPVLITNSSITKPKITTNSGITKFCDGDSIILSSNITATKYQWNYLSSPVADATAKNLSTSLQGAYSVTAINEFGCKATSDISLILTTPKPSVAAIDGVNALCIGATSKLTNASVGGVWSSGAESIIKVDASGNISSVAAGTGAISYTITSNGCSNTSKINIKVNETPVAPKADNVTLCVGGTSTALIANASGGHSLLWYGSNATGGQSSGTSPIPSTNAQGSADYYVSQSNNSTTCESPRTKISVSVGPAPVTPSITRDASGNLNSSATIGNQWYKNGAEIIGATSTIYKPTEVANYSVKVQGTCVSPMSTTYYFLVTDVINLSATEFIKLAPNPFQTKLNFDFVVKGYQKLNMDVFELATGRKVSSRVGLTPGSPVYLPELVGGIYIVRITSADGKLSYQFKMVKM